MWSLSVQNIQVCHFHLSFDHVPHSRWCCSHGRECSDRRNATSHDWRFWHPIDTLHIWTVQTTSPRGDEWPFCVSVPTSHSKSRAKLSVAKLGIFFSGQVSIYCPKKVESDFDIIHEICFVQCHDVRVYIDPYNYYINMYLYQGWMLKDTQLTVLLWLHYKFTHSVRETKVFRGWRWRCWWL